MPERFWRVYWPCKLLLAAFIPLLLLEAGLQLPLVAYAVVGLAGSSAIDVWLWFAMRNRQRRIAYALSYFIDMTIALLRAGVNLDTAIGQAIEYGLPSRNPLRKELLITRREIMAGRSRDEAFAALWPRTGVSELQSLVNAFRIGSEIGRPIVGALERQAELLRERALEKYRKRINVKAAQAMVPLVLLNFPMMGMIVFYPPLLEITNAFLSF